MSGKAAQIWQAAGQRLGIRANIEEVACSRAEQLMEGEAAEAGQRRVVSAFDPPNTEERPQLVRRYHQKYLASCDPKEGMI